MKLAEEALAIVQRLDPPGVGARNLKDVEVIEVSQINPINLIGFQKVLFTVNALNKAEESLK
jgi:DNA-directed RNA polymerase specialized sigma54-like protein